MSTATTPRGALAQAVREVNRCHGDHPCPPRTIFTSLQNTVSEIDGAVAAGDAGTALALVAAWRDEALRLLATSLLPVSPAIGAEEAQPPGLLGLRPAPTASAVQGAPAPDGPTADATTSIERNP